MSRINTLRINTLRINRRWAAVCAGLLTLLAVTVPLSRTEASAVSIGEVTRPPAVTVSYGTDPLQTIDVYGATRPNAKLVVMIPGDGWRSMINMNMEVTTARQLQSAGFAVFDMSYRGDSPTVPAFPMETDDVMAATAWAVAHATTYGADPNKVILLGGSAGGQLAAYSSLLMNTFNPRAVSLVVTLSGPFDFPTAIAFWNAQTGPVASLHLDNQLDALGCTSVATCPASVENQWSTDQRVTSANCPANWLLFNSSAEVMPVQQADLMTAALLHAGCHAQETIVPGSKHGFGYFATVQSQVDAAIDAA